MRKKHCEFYYTTRHMETVERNNHSSIKMYAWFIRNDKLEVMQSSLDDKDIWGDRDGLYYSKVEAELDAKEAIEDHYR